jgi:nitrite reductase/ring-hydroxylating ferredoxin subunit
MAARSVCRVEALADGTAIRFDGPTPIAIFRVAGEFFAIDDTCTHARFSLSEGYIDGATVECALHSARFCLRTGKVLSPPASVPVRTYPVRIEDGEIFVDVS